MSVQQKKSASSVSRRIARVAAVIGIFGYASYSTVTVKSQPSLQLGTFYASTEKPVPTVCISGVRYYTVSERPSSAAVDQDGLALPCDELDKGLEQFGARYRLNCTADLELVNFIEPRQQSRFTLYDRETLRPKKCTAPQASAAGSGQ
ncbi:hypothetical protein DENIT_20119 [Pseudomonas veronii]|nr:hypothetical protein DENIT_20119 [Pseudomonas veronii]